MNTELLRAGVLKRLASVAAIALVGGVAQADLTGDTVDGAIVGGPGAFVVVPPSAVVGGGVEFNIEFVGTPSHSIDIGAASVRIENIFGNRISTGAGEVLVLSDLDSVDGPIIGIDNFQTNEEYTIDDVTFTATEIRFEMAPNIWEIDGFVSFDIVFEGGGGCDADLTDDQVDGAIVGGPGAFVVVPPTAIVGAGVEFNVEFVGTPSHSIDIGAASVRIDNIFGNRISTGAGEVLVLSDMDGGGPIIGIDNFQTNEDYTIGDVTFTATEIRFAMAPNIWEIDGFVSWDIVFDCGGCPADLDGDGDADSDDFFLYLDAFAAGDLAVCDIDGDGDCDSDDFFAYLDLFAAGC